jgi:hypothetical protein
MFQHNFHLYCISHVKKELKKFQRYKEKKILSKNPDKIFSHVSNFLKPKSSGISVLKNENQVVSKSQEQVELFRLL